MIDMMALRSAEIDILAACLESSEPFRVFYQIERPRIAGPITWQQFERLDPGFVLNLYEGQAILNYGERVIKLPHIPAQADETLIIAHELAHLVIFERFPTVAPLPAEYRPNGPPGSVPFYDGVLAAGIGGLVHEILANVLVASYGFDLKDHYAGHIVKRGTFENVPAQGSDEWLRWVLQACGTVSALDLAGGGLLERFESWFVLSAPTVAVEARGLLTHVYGHGFSTPDAARDLLAEVIAHYNLQSRLCISFPPKGV